MQTSRNCWLTWTLSCAPCRPPHRWVDGWMGGWGGLRRHDFASLWMDGLCGRAAWRLPAACPRSLPQPSQSKRFPLPFFPLLQVAAQEGKYLAKLFSEHTLAPVPTSAAPATPAPANGNGNGRERNIAMDVRVPLPADAPLFQ